MYNFKHYHEHLKHDTEEINKMVEIIEDALDELEDEAYYHTMCQIHELVYGNHFDEYLAKKAVCKMKNVDGTVGEHWPMEQTDPIAMQQGIKHKADFYYVLNMMYSDYSNIFGGDANTYIKLAHAYMCDPDAPEGKAFLLWVAKMRAEKAK